MSFRQGAQKAEWPRRAVDAKSQMGVTACPICTSADLEYAFVVEKYPVCQCQGCSLLFLNPQPPQGASSAPVAPGALEPDGAEAHEVIERLQRYSKIEVRNVLILRSESPFLENEAASAGWSSVVLPEGDPAFLLQGYPENSFDACVVYGRLEQTSDPLQALAAIRRVLKPDASLLVAVASIDSLPARVLRDRWWEFSSRSCFYFGVNTLQNLLLKGGFCDPLVYSGDGFVSSELPRSRQARWHRPFLRLVAGVGRFSRRSLGKRMRRYVENRLAILVRPKAAQATAKLSIILPVYNERETFSQLADLVLNKRIENVDIEIIVVESNSTDGTREEVLKLREHPRVKVLLEDRPRGKGRAVRTGLEHATGDVVLIQDADLEYDINEYESLIRPILSYEQNFVIGSRHNGLGRTWKIRKFSDSAGMSHLFNFGHVFFLTLFNRLYGQSLEDPFSMFKVFRRDCLYGLEFECNRFDFDFEIAIKLIRKGYRPVEIPVNYQSRSMAEGKKVTLVRDPLTWLRALVKFRRSPLYRQG